MKLTKLELSGFKSFADTVTLTFEEGVTAIVGPNGCGKIATSPTPCAGSWASSRPDCSAAGRWRT